MIFMFLGIVLLALVLRDVFQTVVPRGKVIGIHVAPILVRKIFWPPFRFAASKIPSPLWKAEVLGLFAPFVLTMLLAIWMCMLIAAFGLISFAFASEYSPPLESPLTALYVSGSSVLTLGSSDHINRTATVRLLSLAAAFIGMVLTASVVSLMFVLIGSIQRREILVSLTTNIGGSPPTGIAILETYALMNGQKSLAIFYEDWHLWCADVLVTHKAYPILPYFHSTDAFTSWITALGATLDSVSLLLSVNRDVDCFPAKVMYTFGCRLVNDMARNWNVKTSQLPELNDGVFHDLYLRLKASGYCVNDEDTAKNNFALLRGQYLPAHLAICHHVAMPNMPLTSEHRLSIPTLASSA